MTSRKHARRTLLAALALAAFALVVYIADAELKAKPSIGTGSLE